MFESIGIGSKIARVTVIISIITILLGICGIVSVLCVRGGYSDAQLQGASAANGSQMATVCIIVITVLIIAAVAASVMLCSALKRDIADTLITPMVRVAEMLEELGKGHLGARAGIKCQDEPGNLAASADALAERLQSTVLPAMKRISEGDLSVDIKVIDNRDEIGCILKDAVQSLRRSPTPTRDNSASSPAASTPASTA